MRDKAGALIDQALILIFDEGASFTGEASAEFHLHGSPAIVSAVLGCLAELEDLRSAEPGEFTRRALENDRMDLAQVEGLADLIEAETEAQRVQAMRVFSGALGDKVEFWRNRLIRAAALIEATIDFADEEVPEDVWPEVTELLTGVRGELRSEIVGVAVAERIRDGFEVAIVGAPNVGKSTLLNRLAGREAAITSEIAGTTRDVIEVRMDLRGIPVTFLDTAGLRVSDDLVESLGIARAVERARKADVRVCVLEAQGEATPLELEPGDLVLVGKADTGNGGQISGHSGEGLDWLVDRIGSLLEDRAQHAGLAIRDRHRIAMQNSVEAIDKALALISRDAFPELVAETLRTGILVLAIIVGRVNSEVLLDEIFSRFCLGK